MASAFSHIAVPVALRIGAGRFNIPGRLLLLAMLLSIAPDFDVIGRHFGADRGTVWGHRGFTHSIAFAAFVALLMMAFAKPLRTKRWIVFAVSFLSMMSHGFLDAITNGGAGVAFFWPFSSERSFFPWRVVEVSPLGVARFFTERGLVILKSELIYIWLPCLIPALVVLFIRKIAKAPLTKLD